MGLLYLYLYHRYVKKDKSEGNGAVTLYKLFNNNIKLVEVSSTTVHVRESGIAQSIQ
jgi:hypothetical protein